jgi:hypothetical protein
MKSDNIYNSANPKDKTRAFNSDAGSFADTAHAVTCDERNAAFDNVDRLIAATKAEIKYEW